MRVFKPTYTNRTGKKQRTSKWYIDFIDHIELRHRFPAFTDKRQSQTLGENVEALVNCKIASQRPDRELQAWLAGLPYRLMRKLLSWGLVDCQRAEGGKPLTEHLENWKNSLVASGCTQKHLKSMLPRVEKTIKQCRFCFIHEIDPVKVETYLVKLRDKGETVTLKQIDRETKKPKTKTVKISKTTFNYYVRACRQFGKWLVDAGRTDKNPFWAIRKVSVTASDQVRVARTLSIEEVRRLIEKTERSDDYRGISGKERALIYILANESGLRANEIRQVKVSDFDFDKALLTVRDDVAKNRKKSVLPLKKRTAMAIQSYVNHKHPVSNAFKVPNQPHLMIKADEASE